VSRIRTARALLVLGLLVIGAGADARSLQQVLNTGTLRVGVVLAAPWAMRDDAEALRGFEIDVANKLAADMQVKVELLVYPIAKIIPALEAGEIDLIAAGLTITPERALHVNFSAPYASGGVSLATNLAKTATVEKLEDLDAADRSIAAVRDSVAVDLVPRVLPRAELVLFDDLRAAADALVNGEVDGLLETEPTPTFLALEHAGAVDVPLARPLLETQMGFAIGKGDADLIAFLNAWIVARQADTWLPTTHRYWFDSLRWRDR
jgi:polar amino acid transport system substrate-binding protein